MSDMNNLLENFVNNRITEEIEEKEWGLSKKQGVEAKRSEAS